jgi:hypothetical protein
LPGANAADVCEALQQWHSAEGYERVTSRLLFECRYTEEEVRAYVMSNERWCVVLYSDAENTSKLRRALSRFPAVVQLWADDDRWGYHFDEYGEQVARFGTLRRRASLWEGDLAHVASACGVPEALPRLKRIQSGRFLFNEKPCSEFCDALQAPVAALSFHAVDEANAGMIKERLIAGWKCQMLCFLRRQPKTNENRRNDVPSFTPQLTDADRQTIARMEKKIKWLRCLVAPITFVAGLLTIPLVALLVVAGLVGSVPGVRRSCFGKSVAFRDDFVRQLSGLPPKLILIQGESVTNTRHGCSLTVCPPAKACPDVLPRKGSGHDEVVFDIAMGKDFLACLAYSPGREPKWSGVEVLEKQSFAIQPGEVQFEKRRTTNLKRAWFQYEWTLRTPQAVYQFFNSRKIAWTARELEVLENVVRSFKMDRADA